MPILWFCLVAIMIAAYVILDGFDIGAGIIHLSAARTDAEREAVLATIGPVWDGNEVWLIAGGGTLYFAFPALYAAGFSGFYLPLMMVLWLLILRGISIEFRHLISNPIWRPFWDVIFCGSSALLAVFYGAALGNVIRGVPLDNSGFFFLPLWYDFRLGRNAGILDWYTVLIGVAAFFTLTLHGSLWVALKTTAHVCERAKQIARRMWWGVAALSIVITAVSFRVQPHLVHAFAARPWGWIFPILAVIGIAGVRIFLERSELRAFLCSSLAIAGMLGSAAFGLFPNVLPAAQDPRLSLTVYNASAATYGLTVGLAWWIPAFILVIGYFVLTYRRFAGKVETSTHGY